MPDVLLIKLVVWPFHICTHCILIIINSHARSLPFLLSPSPAHTLPYKYLYSIHMGLLCFVAYRVYPWPPLWPWLWDQPLKLDGIAIKWVHKWKQWLSFLQCQSIAHRFPRDGESYRAPPPSKADCCQAWFGAPQCTKLKVLWVYDCNDCVLPRDSISQLFSPTIPTFLRTERRGCWWWPLEIRTLIFQAV